LQERPGEPWTVEQLARTVGAIAHRVGYASPFSFSAAFKREYGVSPQAYRTGEDQPDVAAT
ncbi:AraC family transcriptional regulator, partial [Arsenicicoccus bolidensis]|uniref:AraC family transcriptional regulator n=1 Tax=Arsenicicoccus bolidensis TaxID=229480 RepID=UPI0028B23D50